MEKPPDMSREDVREVEPSRCGSIGAEKCSGARMERDYIMQYIARHKWRGELASELAIWLLSSGDGYTFHT